MIPDYKCRSRQKNNRRKLIAPVIPRTRAFFPRGIRAGTAGNHITRAANKRQKLGAFGLGHWELHEVLQYREHL